MADLNSIILDSVVPSSSIINEETLKEEVKVDQPKENIFSNIQLDESDIIPEETITTKETIPDDSLFKDIELDSIVASESDEGVTYQDTSEPSTWDKLEYGWDKERWVAGDVLRIAKAAIQGGLDKDKTFKDYAIENEIKKVEDFEKEHWKMLDGKYDGKYTTIGKAVSWITDPYYLAGYYYGRGFLTSPLTSMAFNAALIGGGNTIHQLAQKGEVDWVEAGMSAGVGGTIGLAFPIAGNIIKKYLPSATKKEALRIEEWINNKVAQKNNLEPHELAKLRKVSEAAPVKKLTNDLDKWAVNHYGRSVKEIIKLNKLERELISERSAVYKTTKFLIQKVKERKYDPLKAKEIRKDGATQIAEKRQLVKEAKKAFDESQIKNIKIQADRSTKYYLLEGKRLAAIMEQINATDNFANKALKAVMANITRPAAFGLVGAGGNVLFGEEEDFWTWVGTGVAFGAAQKGIMNSKTLTIGQKDIIKGWLISDATKFTLQKTRDILAGTTFSKLASYGGPLEKFSKFMMRGVDESLSSQSVGAQHLKMQNHWLDRINTMLGNASKEEMAAANSINRGNRILEANATPQIKKLAKDIKVFLDDFNEFTRKAGVVSKIEIQNYFPRVLDYVTIQSSKQNEAAAIKTIAEIYRLKGVEGKITKKTLKNGSTNPDYGRDKATVLAENYLSGHKNGFDSVVNGAAFADIIKKGSNIKTAQRLANEKELIYTPVSDHIAHNRSLTGPYDKVEAILERDGLLINDTRDILNKLVNDTVTSVAFARKFGTHGELLKPILNDIIKKYRASTLTESQQTMGIAKEADLMMNTINAYFNRFGSSGRNQLKASMGIISMLSNLNMLGRVTISSLGDLVQPVQHSSKWTSAIRGLLRTNLFRAQWEKGPARNMNYHFTNEMNKAVFKSAGLEGNNVAFRQGFMGNWRDYGVKDIAKTSTWNNIAFKALGLEWLTGYARRFAYNTAAIDAHLLARSYVKAVQKNGANSRGALLILDDLTKYNIKANQALTIGKFKNFDSALKNKVSNESLNAAGMVGSNRDALIPQFDNRLLFTQSQTPWIRILGQFLSWAQAKSAQTNKILMRVENGDVRQLIKTLAVIPVYGGIQQLREIAKYGEVHTHPDYDTAKFLAKSGQLSGMPGWVVDLFMNRFLGPGKRDPWFNFAPAFSIMGSAGTAAKQVLDKKPDQAMQTLSKRFLPLPNWRRWIKRWWFDLPKLKGTDVGTKVTFSKGGRIGYEQGEEVILPKEKPTEEIIIPKKKPMNKKDMAAILAAGSIAASGINFDMDKAVANDILPKKKPDIEKVEKVKYIPNEKYKEYKNNFPGEPEKKDWLLDTAEKVYSINKDDIIPNEIILAINGEETGWGTGRFYKEANNLFSMVIDKSDQEYIAATQRPEHKVRVFNKPEDSIKQFLHWVKTREDYEPVRLAITNYKEGIGSKEDIIDAIANTAYAENPNWASNVKGILNDRIDGKEKNNLQKFANKLFSGPNKELRGEKLTNNTGDITTVGKPIFKWFNPEKNKYENVSEKSMTFNIEDKWVNVPSIHNGVMYNEKQIRKMLEKNLINVTSVHKSKEDAEKTAKLRSNTLQ